MKKLLCIILTFCLLLSAMIIPTIAQTEKTSQAISGINYYNWDFSEDTIYTDYSKAQPHPQGLKTAVSTFDPILNGMDGNEYGYKTEHATINGKDALRVVCSGSGYKTAIVPLMSDGKAFYMEPGKSYIFSLEVTFKANANTTKSDYYSGTMFGVAPGTNLRSNAWNGTGGSPLGLTGKTGYVGINSFRSIYDMYDLRTIPSSDIGGTANTTYSYKNGALTETATPFNVSETGLTYAYNLYYAGDYLNIPALEFGEWQLVTNAQTKNVYREDAVGCFQNFGAYGSSYTPQSTHSYYNQYFALELPACKDVYVKGNLPDAIEDDKIEVDGEIYSHAYVDMYITKLAIIEKDCAVVELYDGETKISEMTGAIGEKVQLYTPEAPEGKIFNGWYLDKELTVSASNLSFATGITEVYASYIDVEKTNVTLKNGDDIQVISGYPGAPLTLPETGIIDNNWYTDYKNYKIFTETTFPTEDIELHSAKGTLDSDDDTTYCSGLYFNTSTKEDENGQTVPTLLFDGTKGKYEGVYRLGKVEDQVTYKLTFSYYPETLNKSFDINLITASYANAYSFSMYVEGNANNKIYTINTDNSTAGQWNKAEIFFTANINGVLTQPTSGNDFTVDTTGFDALYVSMRNGGEDKLQMKDFVITPIENALTSGGASILTGEAEEVAGGQAIRFYFDYKTTDGKTIILGDKEYEIIERGVIFRNGATYADRQSWGYIKQRTPNNTISYKENSALSVWGVKEEALCNSWDYNKETNTLRYSYYVYGFEVNDTKELMARGFVTFKDVNGNVFTIYCADINRSVAFLSFIR